VRDLTKKEIETGIFNKRPEVPVACEEEGFVVDATLSDEGIAKPSLAAMRQHLRSQHASPLPPPTLRCWIEHSWTGRW